MTDSNTNPERAREVLEATVADLRTKLAAATPVPWTVGLQTVIGSIAPAPFDVEYLSDWYDWNQPDGPDFRFVAETTTNTKEGAANAALIAAAMRALPALLDAASERPERETGEVALRNAAQAMVDDHQTSETHHPDHILVPKHAFDRMVSALATPLPSGGDQSQDARVGEGRESLADFGALMFDALWERFTDGTWEIEVNDLITVEAQKCGLVHSTDFDPDVHDDLLGGCEPGDDFYEITGTGRDALKRARSLSSALSVQSQEGHG